MLSRAIAIISRMISGIMSVGLLVFLSLFISACAKQELVDANSTAVTVWYLDKMQTELVSYETYIGTGTVEEQALELLSLLSQSPDEGKYVAALRESISIFDYNMIEGGIILHMGDRYATFEKTLEVLIRGAIVKTLTQIDGIGFVNMTINGVPLTDTKGTALGSMTAEDFVVRVGEEGYLQEVTLKLYFASSDGTALVPVMRKVSYSGNQTLEKLVLEQMILGPDGEGYATVNPSCRVLSVYTLDGVCYVNMDDNFKEQPNRVSGEVTIYSLVNSLVEIKGINKVQIMIDNEQDIRYRDTISLSTIFERNLDIIE